MSYRTRTYIAGDWTENKNLISSIQHWNESSWWGLSFSDAHDLTQARDTSLPCSIKSSLRRRLEISKTFVLIVSDTTNGLTKGGCRYCASYSPYGGCHRSGTVDHRSFIDYECAYAVDNHLNIVVIYNDFRVDKDKCPILLRNIGTHLPAIYVDADGSARWDINGISNVICG